MNGVRRGLVALGARAGRIRPDLVPAPHLAWIVACWLLTVGLATLILVPGATDAVTATPAGSSGLIGLFAAPLGIRLVLVVVAGLLAGVLVVALRLSDAGRVAREAGLAAAAGFPALALAADRLWLPAAIALVAVVLAEVVAHRTAARAPTAGVFAAATWVPVLVAQFGTPDAALGWTWIALFGFAAAFAAFGSYYGVARAAESRARWLRPLFRDDVPALVVAGIVVLVAVLTVLRLTVARDLFPEPDPQLWSPWAAAPISWLHGAAVAVLVVVIAASSVRHPLRRSHERRVTAALAVAGNADLAAGVVVILAGLAIAAVSGEFVAPGIPPELVAALKLLGVVGIVVVAMLPPFRGTAARALALITGAYLVPLTVQGLLRETGLGGASGFAATPVQVALPLLAVAVAGAAVPVVRRTLGAGLVVRLAVVPFVAVHAGWLLPAAWSDLGRIVLVVGVLLAILFLLPKPTADRTRHTLDLLAASGTQLLALGVFILALPSFLDDPQIVVLGLFWLAIAVVAALTVRTAGGDDQSA